MHAARISLEVGGSAEPKTCVRAARGGDALLEPEARRVKNYQGTVRRWLRSFLEVSWCPELDAVRSVKTFLPAVWQKCL